MLDELLYGDYNKVSIQKPVITISVPRGGTTSFHRTLALDERFVTPNMLELVMPFLSLHKLVLKLNQLSPGAVKKLEQFLKWINGVTPAVDARHPISLLAPDADDILLGEWHWISVGAVRTFPVAEYWKKHYQMNLHDKERRERSLLLHKRLCQKILYHRGGHSDVTTTSERPDDRPRRHCRLLLRSHLSPCIQDFKRVYPDAHIVGILRDPVDVLQSFAGLSTTAVLACTGINMLDDNCDLVNNDGSRSNNNNNNNNNNNRSASKIPWPQLFVEILSDMMGNEISLYDERDIIHVENPWKGRCHHVSFEEFKNDPLKALEYLYKQTELPLTQQMQLSVQKGLAHHESYKTRHAYQNPTLMEMNLDKETYLNLPNVRRYGELLQERKLKER